MDLSGSLDYYKDFENSELIIGAAYDVRGVSFRFDLTLRPEWYVFNVSLGVVSFYIDYMRY